MENKSKDPFEDISQYSTDVMLLRSLGLPNWTGKLGVETHIGDVRPFAEEEPTDQQTLISVYVTAVPTQVFHFIILRRSENFDGMEKLEVRTGSGTLENYWEMALAVTSNMLVISAPEPV